MVVEASSAVSEILYEQQSVCIDVQLKLLVSNPNTDSVSIDLLSVSDYSIVSRSASIKSTLVESTTTTTKTKRFSPSIRSGSHTDIGPRRANEDAHIQIDDLSKQLKDVYKWDLPSSFYAIFDGHGGSEASSFVKQNAMRLFFQDSDLPQAAAVDFLVDDDDKFLKQVEDSNRKAFLLADQALAEECSVSDYCGTTALTVLVLGRHLLIANAGDCRAVLSRKGGVAVQMTQDHRPSYLQEKKRVEEHGGYFEDGYLNGEIAVTRTLGDRHMKKSSPLIAEPELRQMVLNEDDEFMIIGCDGIWDVMSNQEAVALVRTQLSQHNDPQRCATELINQALRLHTSDNLTAIVVCFSSQTVTPDPQPKPKSQPWRPRFRCSNALSEEAQNTPTRPASRQLRR